MNPIIILALAKSYTNRVALGQGAVQIPGPPGNDGKTPQFRIHDDRVQLRFSDDETWQDLLNLLELLIHMPIDNHTLKFNSGALSVNTTTEIQADNTRPITASGVYKEVGNIQALLESI